MTTASIWDSPEFSTGGEFVKFEKIGDSVAGKVENIGRKTWDDGSVSPQLDITTDEGEARTLTAGQVRLKVALAEKRPEIGDHIKVELVDIIKRPGGKTLKDFSVVVTKADVAAANARLGNMAGGTPAAAPAGDDEPPF